MSATWDSAFLILAVLVCINTFVSVALMRQIGVLSQRIRPVGAMEGDEDTGPVRGTILSDAALHLASGSTAGNLFDTDYSLLIFISPTCGVCSHLLKPAATVSKYNPDIGVFFVAETSPERARDYANRNKVRLPIYVSEGLFEKWGIKGTPFAALVSRDRTIVRSGVVNTLEHIESLLRAPVLPNDHAGIGPGHLLLEEIEEETVSGPVVDASEVGAR